VEVPLGFVGRRIYLGMPEKELIQGRSGGISKGELGYVELLSHNSYFKRADYFVDDGILHSVALRTDVGVPESLFPVAVLDSLSSACDKAYGEHYLLKKSMVFGAANGVRAWPIGNGQYAFIVYEPFDSALVIGHDSVSLGFVLGEDSTQWMDVGAHIDAKGR
jgi:hypothetical protein